MGMTIEQVFIEKLRSLPPAQQQEALNFVDFLQTKHQNLSSNRTRWEGMSALDAARSVMGEVGDAPPDLSTNPQYMAGFGE
jgi:hypothetical protein